MSETIIADQLANAEAELMAASGGQGLCRATSVDVKLLEGRYTALRALLKEPQHLPEMLDAAHRALALAQRTNRGKAWVNYEQGRVTALEEVAELLGSAAT